MPKIPTASLLKLKDLLDGSEISSARTQYQCCHFGELAVVFSASDGTKKVMLPTEVVFEWVSAFDAGVIDDSMNAQQMRDAITEHSEWATYQHGFTTHLRAIVNAWAKPQAN